MINFLKNNNLISIFKKKIKTEKTTFLNENFKKITFLI